MTNEPYDVFISYSRADGRHAAEIDSILRDKGLKTLFERGNIAAGLPWVRALEQVIGAARAMILLIGPRGLGNTQQYERELAFLHQTRYPAFPIVPVILPETTTDLPFDFLRVLTWIDFSHVRRVSDAPDVIEQLFRAIGGWTSADATRLAVCPYRGLDAFREEDAAFYFGRGSADTPNSPIGELVCKVREHPFVMVMGRSGSGKSSLVYAGLLPALRRERDQFWSVLSLRPGPEPLRALAAAFNPRANGERGNAEYLDRITREVDGLRTGDPELLSHMIRGELGRAEGKPGRMLLYIDQWEELYALAPPSSEKERFAQHAADVNRFIDLLLTAARTAPISIVGTMRADFYDPLIGHQEIKSLLPIRQVVLRQMLRSELERAIVEPANIVGIRLDPSLVELILDEVGEDEGALSLLQYALKEAWHQREGDTITADSYVGSGGVRRAIRITAEREFDNLSAREQDAARRLFLRLVTPGEGQEDTRARAAMPEEPAQRKLIEKFAAPRTRLLVTGWDRSGRPTVQVTHEILIRTWPPLRVWIDANREKLHARAAILQAKAEWEQNHRRDDMLLPAGLQLERARSLLADPGDLAIDDIQEFIGLSSAREGIATPRIGRPTPSVKVFISYRREDSKWPARQIYEAFLRHLPPEQVFIDIDSILPGADFVEILEQQVEACEKVLALIGPCWIGNADPKTGRRRLDNPNDFVRIEICAALSRAIPVVPVLLEGAPMPEVNQLPEDMRMLVRKQAEFVEYRTFDTDVDRLIKRLGFGKRTT